MIIEKAELSEQEIQENYSEFIKYITKSFTGERQERLLKLYSEDELGLEAATAPASTCEHFHLAYPGGYIQHIMNVVKASYGVKKLWQAMGCNIDFTDEEMNFSALHHDLGKLGDVELGTYYKPQDQDWLTRRGEAYRLNPDNQYMEVTDRAVFTLQKYGVKMTWKEYLGIKLADGMYNDASHAYLKTYKKEFFLKTNLPRIIHQADFMASRAEYDSWAFPKS